MVKTASRAATARRRFAPHSRTSVTGDHSTGTWEIYIHSDSVAYDRSDGVAALRARPEEPAPTARARRRYGALHAGRLLAGRRHSPARTVLPGLGGGGGNGCAYDHRRPVRSANEGNVIYRRVGCRWRRRRMPRPCRQPRAGGGGASIAALVFASPGLSFTTCELVAGNGGNGGKGAFRIGADRRRQPRRCDERRDGGDRRRRRRPRGLQRQRRRRPERRARAYRRRHRRRTGHATTPGTAGAGVAASPLSSSARRLRSPPPRAARRCRTSRSEPRHEARRVEFHFVRNSPASAGRQLPLSPLAGLRGVLLHFFEELVDAIALLLAGVVFELQLRRDAQLEARRDGALLEPPRGALERGLRVLAGARSRARPGSSRIASRQKIFASRRSPLIVTFATTSPSRRGSPRSRDTSRAIS